MVRQVSRHAGINDNLPRPQQPGHHAHCSAARQEVEHHLSRNFLWIRRYALGYHTMVASRDNNCLAFDNRTLIAEYARKLHRHILKPT
jgi:hypothetical protein